MSLPGHTAQPRQMVQPEGNLFDYAQSRSRYNTPVHDDDYVLYEQSAYSHPGSDVSFVSGCQAILYGNGRFDDLLVKLRSWSWSY